LSNSSTIERVAELPSNNLRTKDRINVKFDPNGLVDRFLAPWVWPYPYVSSQRPLQGYNEIVLGKTVFTLLWVVQVLTN